MKNEPTKKAEIEAVCLRDCSLGSAGEIVMLSQSTAEAGVGQGMVDAHPDAVKHAKANKK